LDWPGIEFKLLSMQAICWRVKLYITWKICTISMIRLCCIPSWL